MELAALVLFAGTLLVAAASPGPGIAALVAQVIGKGANSAPSFAAGLILGDLVWLAVAILGLAVVAQTFTGSFSSSNMPAPPTSFISPTACGRRRSKCVTLRQPRAATAVCGCSSPGLRSRWGTPRWWHSISRCCPGAAVAVATK